MTLLLATLGMAGSGSAANVANLQDRLEKDLEARRPQELAFVAKVVALVEADVLPRRTVDAVFLWARKKPRNKFQYFAQGLRRRAALLGIKID